MASIDLGRVVIIYFVVGATMWGGGAIDWNEAGIGNLIIDVTSDGDVERNSNTSDDLERLGGPIEESQTTISGGGLLAVLEFLRRFLGFLFWPVSVFQSHNAPVGVTVLFGGTLSMSMLVAALAVFYRS